MAISAFSNLSISISNGGTAPSLDYLSNKTYVNIGSGNVFRVYWNTPTASNNVVDSYKIYILYYDQNSASYKALYNTNIGKVNEFYVKSSIFDPIQKSFLQLRVYVEAISTYGSSYNGTSNTISVNVATGSGHYTEVSAGYMQPIMKRTLAFAKLDKTAMKDGNGKVMTDSSGKTIYTKASSVQDDNTNWTLMQEFYSKDTAGAWKKSDIKYEVLTDTNGEVVTDSNDSPIYIL